MDFRRFGDTLVVRLDKGEEILSSLSSLARRERILLAEVSALGATDDFTVGVLDTREKRFLPRRFTGDHEIVSLTGTVTALNGEPYLHLHMSAGSASGEVVGGHLQRAVVSVTCEMIVRTLDGCVGRRADADTGINVMDFT